ncbi:AraC family transcriptional regulator [Nocardia vermiculata]|uniref:AraC family transcriptional regulator n=1 Tax=Nocardia vermiculata TaxID=257274 RepID=A0A846XRZ8_9NOCA|nr:AraC family transcriptional regulator [Nocardia vermiculata]NKY49367.1 AraC family transcriptional regulator [Nocardia vermiculata]
MHTVESPEVRTWNFARGIASVTVMTEFAAERGIPAERLLSGSGIAPAALADPAAQIPAEAELRVVRNLVAELGDVPGLGIEVGRRYRLSTFGIFGFACVTSPTLREAISLALRYYRLGFAFCTPIVEYRNDDVVAWIHHELIPADVQQFLVERDIVAMHRVMGDLLGHDFAFARIEFGYPAPRYADRIRGVLGAEPAYGRPHTMFTVAPQILAQPLPQANQQTWAVCIAQCRDLVQRRSARTGIAAEVRERLLPGSGATGITTPPPIEVVARDLTMSVRTLRRRLTDAGTSYRALLDEVRRALAQEMLSGTPLTIDDIAIRLGYAEATPFIHAFKRWTGTTPAAYRRDRNY